MPIKQLKHFTNSKIASRKIISDNTGNLNIDKPGNRHKTGIGLSSKSKSARNPTSGNR